MIKVKCDLCGKDTKCKNNKFLCLELFADEIYREGHQKSLDCWNICIGCYNKMKKQKLAGEKLK